MIDETGSVFLIILLRCLIAFALFSAVGFSPLALSAAASAAPSSVPSSAPVFTPRPLASRGVIDLRSWNFTDQGPINLTGEYEF